MATVALGAVVGSRTSIGSAAAAGPMARSTRSVGSAVGAYPNPSLGTSHATPEVVRLVTALYRDKTARDIDLALRSPSPPTVWQGNIAIKLDRHGKVSRFTSVWDGTLTNDTTLTTLLVATIEH